MATAAPTLRAILLRAVFCLQRPRLPPNPLLTPADFPVEEQGSDGTLAMGGPDRETGRLGASLVLPHLVYFPVRVSFLSMESPRGPLPRREHATPNPYGKEENILLPRKGRGSAASRTHRIYLLGTVAARGRGEGLRVRPRVSQRVSAMSLGKQRASRASHAHVCAR